MKRILLDENIPLKLIEFAVENCEVRHVITEGWKRMPDGELLIRAEAAGFDVLLTADRSIAFQQDFRSKRISLVVLTTNNWPAIREHASTIFWRALEAEVASVETIVVPRPPALQSPRRPSPPTTE